MVPADSGTSCSGSKWPDWSVPGKQNDASEVGPHSLAAASCTRLLAASLGYSHLTLTVPTGSQFVSAKKPRIYWCAAQNYNIKLGNNVAHGLFILGIFSQNNDIFY